MKPLLLITIILLFNYKSISQIGIGTTNPHSSAILDIESTTKGFLPPRLTYQNIVGINAPALGLMAYCTNCCISSGGLLAFYSSNGWVFNGENDCDFIDLDRDFVINDLDLDDDNDGILDIDESPSVLLTEEFNGTFGTTSIATDVQGSIPNYFFSTNGISSGVYAVISNALSPNWHPGNIWAYPGHTDGSNTDAFLAVNGRTSTGTFIEQSIPLIPNVEYVISFWHRGVSYNLKIDLIQESNSSSVISTQTGLTSFGEWTELSMTYTSLLTDVQLFRIELSNLSTSASGNDFAIDDISVKPTDPSVNISDYDLDGYNNSLDLDSDGDGIPDNVEYQSTAGYIPPGNSVDAQGRLINYGINGLTSPINIDGDNLLDYLDTDTDGDGTLDKDESGLILTGTDSDKDGLDDGADEEVPGHSDVNGKAINNSNVNILTGGVEKDYRVL